MFTEGMLQIAREVMVVWGAVAVVLVCVILVMLVNVVGRLNRMTTASEQIYSKVMQLLMLPVDRLYRFFGGDDRDTK